MSDETTQTRREFVAGAIAVGGGLVSLSMQRSALGAADISEPRLVLREVVGDPVRFAERIFASPETPDMVAGYTSYADFIVLSGCAAEHGYRVTREETSHSLVAWTVARRPRAMGSE
jgi:hypothetical protein